MTLRTDFHGLTVQAARPGKTQNITLSGVSQVSAAFLVAQNAPTRSADGLTVDPFFQHTAHVRIVSTGACWIAFGGPATPPVASATNGLSFYMPAATPEYFWVVPGEQVAVINDGVSTGIVNIAECVQ